MIKLNRPLIPLKLQKEQAVLTATYKTKQTSVWRKDYIIEPLFISSHGKCAYCENKLNWAKGEEKLIDFEFDETKQINFIPQSEEENNFIHIDHFVARKYDADKVVDWYNLLPSCPVCNYKKGHFNVLLYSIINPYDDNPRDFYLFNGSMLEIKANEDSDKSKANKTISVFDLINRYHKQINPLRCSIDSSLHRLYSDIEEALKDNLRGDNSKLNDCINRFTKLLEYGLPTAKYASFTATIILNHNYFNQLKKRLTEYDFYSSQLIELEKQLNHIKYE